MSRMGTSLCLQIHRSICSFLRSHHCFLASRVVCFPMSLIGAAENDIVALVDDMEMDWYGIANGACSFPVPRWSKVLPDSHNVLFLVFLYVTSCLPRWWAEAWRSRSPNQTSKPTCILSNSVTSFFLQGRKVHFDRARRNNGRCKGAVSLEMNAACTSKIHVA
jgi:hypothetical protein